MGSADHQQLTGRLGAPRAATAAASTDARTSPPRRDRRIPTHRLWRSSASRQEIASGNLTVAVAPKARRSSNALNSNNKVCNGIHFASDGYHRLSAGRIDNHQMRRGLFRRVTDLQSREEIMRTNKRSSLAPGTAVRVVAVAALLASPALAWAATVTPVPEPESLALVGIGVVAMVVARWKKRK